MDKGFCNGHWDWSTHACQLPEWHEGPCRCQCGDYHQPATIDEIAVDLEALQ